MLLIWRKIIPSFCGKYDIIIPSILSIAYDIIISNIFLSIRHNISKTSLSSIRYKRVKPICYQYNIIVSSECYGYDIIISALCHQYDIIISRFKTLIEYHRWLSEQAALKPPHFSCRGNSVRLSTLVAAILWDFQLLEAPPYNFRHQSPGDMVNREKWRLLSGGFRLIQTATVRQIPGR